MTTMTATSTQLYQLFIRATPEAIWDAITKPEFTKRYFYGSRADYDLRAGGALRSYAGDSDTLLVDGEFVEVDPPQKLVHTWHAVYDPELAGEEPSRVTWEIEPQEGGFSKLTVVHDQLEGAPKTAEQVSGEGWMLVLSGLKTLLETGEPLASA
ncbi:MAG TPA: SRPBCC family protein [Gaiellaceae bacterium]